MSTKTFRFDIDRLRHIVSWCSHWIEDFNQCWNTEELIKLHAFAMSEQGGMIDESADRWPKWLTDAILVLPLGGQLDATTYERAKEI